MVTLKAYDMMSLLDINYPDTIPTTNMWAALVYVCNRAGIGLAITEDEFNALPNSGVIPDFSSESVETCRDVVMWIAQTVGSCAFCDYRGLLRIKPFKYEGGNTYDRLFTASERTAIEYSDTRTYLAYLQAYVGKDVRQYSKVTTWTGTDAPHIKEGVLSLPQNPIIQKLSESQQETVNQSYFTNRSYPTRYIKANRIVINNTNCTHYTVKWIKLELGSAATPFVPPDPATELLKCQRYLYRLTQWGRVRLCEYTANFLRFVIATPVVMRAKPSLINGDNLVVRSLNINEELPGFTYEVDSCPGNQILIKANKANHGVTDGTIVASGGDVLFSAEL